MGSLRQLGGLSGFPAAQRKRVRHFRHGPFLHQYCRGAGHGGGRQAQGREPQGGGHHRRRRDERGHGLRGPEQRRCRRLRPAGGAERQRHVDQPARGRAEPLPGATHERPVLCGGQERGQEGAQGRAAAVRTGQALRGAGQGHGGAGHAVREVRLQLHRPHRRPRPGIAHPHAGEHQAPEGAAVPARGDQEGPGLQAGRSRPGGLSRAGQVRSGRGPGQAGHAAQDDLHAGVRPMAVRHGREGRSPGRHHAGHARRLGHGGVREALSRALLRRGHRRTACRDLRRPAWPAKGSSPWWRSTPPSCSAATTS